MNRRPLYLLLLTSGCLAGPADGSSQFGAVGVYRGTWAVKGTVTPAGTQEVGCAGRVSITAQFGPQLQANLLVNETVPNCAAAVAEILSGSFAADGAVTLSGSANARFTFDQLDCVTTVTRFDLQGQLESELLSLRHVGTPSCEGDARSVNLELRFTGSR